MQTTTVTTEARCEALYSSLLSARAEEARLLAEYRHRAKMLAMFAR